MLLCSRLVPAHGIQESSWGVDIHQLVFLLRIWASPFTYHPLTHIIMSHLIPNLSPHSSPSAHRTYRDHHMLAIAPSVSTHNVYYQLISLFPLHRPPLTASFLYEVPNVANISETNGWFSWSAWWLLAKSWYPWSPILLHLELHTSSPSQDLHKSSHALPALHLSPLTASMASTAASPACS